DRVLAAGNAAVVLPGVRGREARSGDGCVRGGRTRRGRRAAASGASTGAFLDGGVVPDALRVRIEVGTVLRRRPAGVPAARRARSGDRGRVAPRAPSGVGDRGRGSGRAPPRGR